MPAGREAALAPAAAPVRLDARRPPAWAAVALVLMAFAARAGAAAAWLAATPARAAAAAYGAAAFSRFAASWPLYCTIPLTAGVFNALTNKLAVTMMFEPVRYRGRRPFGWQGIVPKAARRMGGDVADLLMRELLDVEAMVSRVDADHLAALLVDAPEVVELGVAACRKTFPSAPEGLVRATLTAPRLRRVAASTIRAVQANVTRAVDVRRLCVDRLCDDPRQLCDLFEAAWRNGRENVFFFPMEHLSRPFVDAHRAFRRRRAPVREQLELRPHRREGAAGGGRVRVVRRGEGVAQTKKLPGEHVARLDGELSAHPARRRPGVRHFAPDERCAYVLLPVSIIVVDVVARRRRPGDGPRVPRLAALELGLYSVARLEAHLLSWRRRYAKRVDELHALECIGGDALVVAQWDADTRTAFAKGQSLAAALTAAIDACDALIDVQDVSLDNDDIRELERRRKAHRNPRFNPDSEQYKAEAAAKVYMHMHMTCTCT